MTTEKAESKDFVVRRKKPLPEKEAADTRPREQILKDMYSGIMAIHAQLSEWDMEKSLSGEDVSLAIVYLAKCATVIRERLKSGNF